MTIVEALGNLDQVCSEFKGTRADHVALQQSMQVVSAAVGKAKPKPTKKDQKKEPDGNKKK